MSPRRPRFFLLLLSLFAACSQPASAPPLTVFAAASLTEAFTAIGKDFERQHPGVTVTFNFGGSQALRAQLEQGAVADVFAAASQKEMDAAIAAGVVSGTAAVFLTNQLVVILPEDDPAEVQALEDLARPGLKLVLAAADVPAGDYARQALGKMEAAFGAGFKDRVLANVVSSEDNVRQVTTKVLLGEADAGMVYHSDAAAVPGLRTLPIPAEFNVSASYPIAVLARAPQPGLAAQFVDYVLSSAGQDTLKQWGFTPITP